jgi:hypothetical protein
MAQAFDRARKNAGWDITGPLGFARPHHRDIVARLAESRLIRCEGVLTMTNRFGPILICAAWLTATAAMAEAPATAAQTQSYSFVQSYAATTHRLEQIARWDGPICVQVTGLVPDKAALIKNRVEDVAKALGVKALGAGCASNIEIVFTTDPQKVINDVAKRRDVLLGYEHASDKSLKTVTRPIQAWYVTATAGGAGPNAGAMFAFSNNGANTPAVPIQPKLRVVDDPDNTPPTGCGDSRFSSCLKSVFDNVLVVVDAGRAKDKNLGLISDYVAMVALSQPRSADHCNVLPSVTELFAEACPGRAAPTELTPADAAYLTALYTADAEANGAGQRSDIARRMNRILAPSNVAASGPGANVR